MRPERLAFLIEDCFRHQRKRNLEAHKADIARFFGVAPMTLRRWLQGKAPIPRSVELMMETFHAFPEVTAEAVDNAVAKGRGETVE